MNDAGSRNGGIDILKILSMYMVVIMHILGRGGLDALVPGSFAWATGWLAEIACYVAVNCFAMVSGYLLVDRACKSKAILLLWSQVFFYSLVITLFFRIAKPEMVSHRLFLNSFFPVMRQQYWYFTAYFALYLVLPYFNKLLGQLGKKEYIFLMAIFFALYSVMNTASCIDCFKIDNGCSAVWLGFMYAIGGYVKKFGCGTRKVRFYIGGYTIIVAVAWFLKVIAQMLDRGSSGYLGRTLTSVSSVLISYTSPLIVVATLCLFVGMIGVHWRLPIWVAQMSQMSFAVYLIHTHPAIFDNIFRNAFVFIAEAHPLLQYPLIMLSACMVFVIGICIEKVRLEIFKLCKITHAVASIDNSITQLMRRIMLRVK